MIVVTIIVVITILIINISIVLFRLFGLLFPSVWSSIDAIVLRCFTYRYPLPPHTCQSQSLVLGTSGLVTSPFLILLLLQQLFGVVNHGLVIMRVKATEEVSLSVRVSMLCVDISTNRYGSTAVLCIYSLSGRVASPHFIHDSR